MFLLDPDVEMQTKQSPFFPRACICLEKIYLNPKSFPIAVNALVSVTKDKAAMAFLLNLNLTVNSVARC